MPQPAIGVLPAGPTAANVLVPGFQGPPGDDAPVEAGLAVFANVAALGTSEGLVDGQGAIIVDSTGIESLPSTIATGFPLGFVGEPDLWVVLSWNVADDRWEFATSASSGGGGGASLHIGDSPPLDPNKTLWWNSTPGEARLYVRYDDGDSIQWVDASPSLASINAVVLDTLLSSSVVNALSANQGRVLKALIDALTVRVLVAETNIREIQAGLFQTQAAIQDTSQIPAGTIIWLQPPPTPTSPPTGYLYCSGTERSRAEYPELFNAIGTTYGAGDGVTTFNLPLEASLVNPFPGAVPAYRPYVRVGLAFPLSGTIAVITGGGTVFRTRSFSGSTFTARPDFNIGYNASVAVINADGSYAACANGGDLNILRRNSTTWLNCTIDSLPPGETVANVVFSLDGSFLFVSGGTANHLYTRVSASQWDRSSVGGPAGRAALSISRTGRFITAGGLNQGFALWEVTESGIDFVTADAFPGATGGWFPPLTGWSPGDNLVAVCAGGNPVFARAGLAFAPIPSQPSNMGGDTSLMKFSPDGIYLVGAVSGIFTGVTVGLRLWKLEGGAFVDKNSDIPSGSFRGDFSPDVPGRTPWQFYSSGTGVNRLYEIDTATDTLRIASTTNEPGAAVTGFGLAL